MILSTMYLVKCSFINSQFRNNDFLGLKEFADTAARSADPKWITLSLKLRYLLQPLSIIIDSMQGIKK